MQLLILSLLMLLDLSTAYNLFSSKSRSSWSEQQYLSQQMNTFSQPLPSLLPFPSIYARCSRFSHWQCQYYGFGLVWCHCVTDEILASCNREIEIQENTWLGGGNSTSIEVLAEVQPGNNQTRISLFEIHCNETVHAGCLSVGGEFACGCHWKGFSQAEDGGKNGEDGEDFSDHDGGVIDEERQPDAQVLDETTPGFGDWASGSAAQFRFKKVRWPHCTKIGYSVHCCHYGGKTQCFCAFSGYHCHK